MADSTANDLLGRMLDSYPICWGGEGMDSCHFCDADAEYCQGAKSGCDNPNDRGDCGYEVPDGWAGWSTAYAVHYPDCVWVEAMRHLGRDLPNHNRVMTPEEQAAIDAPDPEPCIRHGYRQRILCPICTAQSQVQTTGLVGTTVLVALVPNQGYRCFCDPDPAVGGCGWMSDLLADPVEAFNLAQGHDCAKVKVSGGVS